MPRDAGERARQAEGGRSCTVGGHAHHFGGILVVDREEAEAEARDGI
jgi:hypothetical protein